eukprot:TRINITY_DN3995_c0_g1_i1.p1 TRINITY_DN3995_c0_g1~~TRINITY_DN3995_c0_g1_i1.p1  ORF type:complete len:1137 (+),score=363.54 TRINITY_DN3995_c0_g1_i1:242-3652(+)
MQAQAAPERFNLYCLEDGEVHVCDVLGCYHMPAAAAAGSPSSPTSPTDSTVAVQGKIRLGTRALYIDASDTAHPIVKIPFSAVVGLGMRETKIVLQAKHTVTMLKSGVVAQQQKQETPGVEHMISLNWEDPANYFRRLQDIVSNHMQGGEYTPPDVAFDYSWIASVTETILVEQPVLKHIPLRSIRGNCVLTQKTLYVGLHESLDGVPLQKIPLGDIYRCARRRLYFQETSIIFHYKSRRRDARSEDLSRNNSSFVRHRGSITDDDDADGTEDESGDASSQDEGVLLLSFASEAACNQVWCILGKETVVPVLKSNTMQAMQQKWLDREMSTYEYLLSLNWAAGRSLNDLSQYPIMPWVIADYESPELDLEDPKTFRDLSKPIGALDDARLQAFKKRKADSSEPYLYGTHYSTPTYVMYYLVREHPEWMLYLHGGKFDNGNRIFSSVAQCWKNVNTLTNDVKELIPQFFNGDGLFLSTDTLDLGVITSESGRPNEQVPRKVRLPPWAEDAKDFVRKNREALESEHVSQHIGAWIDLMFGSSSRGERAEAADNLFHPLTYGYRGAGAGGGARTAMFSASAPPSKAEELQIREFGQSPLQLFTSPHPSRDPPAPHADPAMLKKKQRGHARLTASLQPITKLNSVIVTSNSPRNVLPAGSFNSRDDRSGLGSPTQPGYLHRDPTNFAPVNSSFSLRTSMDKSPALSEGGGSSGSPAPLPETVDLQAELLQEAGGALRQSDDFPDAAAPDSDVGPAGEAEPVSPSATARFSCVASVECMRRNATHAVGLRLAGDVPLWLQRLMQVAYSEAHPQTSRGIDKLVKKSNDTCDDSNLSAVFIAGENGQLPIIDTQNGTRLRTLQMGVHSLTSLAVDDPQSWGCETTPAGNRLLIAGSEDEHLYCYGLDTGRMEERIPCGAACGTGASGVPTALALSHPSTRLLAVGSEHGTVAVYQVDAGGGPLLQPREPVLMEHQGAVNSVAWGSPTSHLFASCGSDGLLVYDTRSFGGGSVMRYECEDAYGTVFVGEHSADTGGMAAVLSRAGLVMLDMRRTDSPLWSVRPPAASGRGGWVFRSPLPRHAVLPAVHPGVCAVHGVGCHAEPRHGVQPGDRIRCGAARLRLCAHPGPHTHPECKHKLCGDQPP